LSSYNRTSSRNYSPVFNFSSNQLIKGRKASQKTRHFEENVNQNQEERYEEDEMNLNETTCSSISSSSNSQLSFSLSSTSASFDNYRKKENQQVKSKDPIGDEIRKLEQN
jgi:hypothetical protein